MKSTSHYFIITFFSLIFVSLTTPMMGQNTAVCTGITPTVTAVDTEGNAIAIQEGAAVQENWVVTTAPDAGVTLNFPNGDTLSMDSGAKVSLSRVDVDKKNKINEIIVKLEEGKVTVTSAKEHNFTVITPDEAVTSDPEKDSTFVVEVTPEGTFTPTPQVFNDPTKLLEVSDSQ